MTICPRAAYNGFIKSEVIKMNEYTIITKSGERFVVEAGSGDAATARARQAGFEFRTGDILVAPNGKRYEILSGS